MSVVSSSRRRWMMEVPVLAQLAMLAIISSAMSGVLSEELVQRLMRSVSSSPPVLTTMSFVVTDVSTTEKPVAENVPAAPGKTPGPEIYSMHVLSQIKYRYALTQVNTRVANLAKTPQEVFFDMVLPETAFISGFLMEVDGKVYKAFVKEKDEAKKVYDQAVSSGQFAAHVAVSARDSNKFSVSVNVRPLDKVSFNLTYEELLTRKLGCYTHTINLNPHQVVRDLVVDVFISESSNLTTLRAPKMRSGNEVTPEDEIKDNELAKVERLSPSKAHVTFAPNADQQKQLSKLKQKEPNQQVEDTVGLLGQFVVEYDVDRSTAPGGEVLVNDGYFVHFFSPEELPPLRKFVVFVLDVSGSMSGRKLDQVKQAMEKILDDLSPNDHFNILEFSYSVKVCNLDEPSTSLVFQPENPADRHWFYDSANPAVQGMSMPEAYPATPDYIAKAKQAISKMSAGGGTNINDALKNALVVARSGLESIRNGSKGNESTPVQPIMIFLTDGDATVGVTRPNKIIATVKEYNNDRCAIFSLAFGEGADLVFLRKLSLGNSGFARNIYEASDAALQLKSFYREVASPLLANVSFNYVPGQVSSETITRHVFDTLFLGSELVVAGRLSSAGDRNNDPLALEITSAGAAGLTKYTQIKFTPAVVPGDKPGSDSSEEDSSQEDSSEEDPEHGDGKGKPGKGKRKKTKAVGPTLERLWAYLTIQQLLDKKHVLDDDSGDDDKKQDDDKKKEVEDIKKKALQIALKYSFVTPLTSLVVVKPNQTSEVDAEPSKPNLMQELDSLPIYTKLALRPLSTVALDPSSSYATGSRFGGYLVGGSAGGSAGPAFFRPMTAPAFSHPPLLLSGSGTTSTIKKITSIDRLDGTETAQESVMTTSNHRTSVDDEDATSSSVTVVPSQPTDAVADGDLTVDDITWLEGVLTPDNSSLALPMGSTGHVEHYKLAVNESNTEFALCKSPQNDTRMSHCRHLKHCVIHEIIHDMEIYRTTYFCPIEGGYAGICCLDSHRVQSHVTLATNYIPTTTETMETEATTLTAG